MGAGGVDAGEHFRVDRGLGRNDLLMGELLDELVKLFLAGHKHPIPG